MKQPIIFVRTLILSLALASLSGCSFMGGSRHLELQQAGLWDLYQGVLPCADCSGIDTQVWLRTDTPTASTGSAASTGSGASPKSTTPPATIAPREYRMVEKRMFPKSPDTEVQSDGHYTIVSGIGKLIRLPIIVLTPNGGGPRRYFLRRANDLELLDQDQNEIRTGLKYTLESQGQAKALGGLFSADEEYGDFYDCASRRTYPVHPVGEYSILEDRYFQIKRKDREVVYTEFFATLTEAPTVNALGVEPAIVIQRFLRIERADDCQ